MHRIATRTKQTKQSFGLNFQPLTDTDSEPQRAAASAGQATANRGEPRGAAAIGGGLLRAAVVSCGEGTRVRARGRKQLTAGTSLHMRRDDSALPFLHLKAKQGDVQKVKPSRGVFRTCIELQREQSKQNKALA